MYKKKYFLISTIIKEPTKKLISQWISNISFLECKKNGDLLGHDYNICKWLNVSPYLLANFKKHCFGIFWLNKLKNLSIWWWFFEDLFLNLYFYTFPFFVEYFIIFHSHSLSLILMSSVPVFLSVSLFLFLALSFSVSFAVLLYFDAFR